MELQSSHVLAGGDIHTGRDIPRGGGISRCGGILRGGGIPRGGGISRSGGILRSGGIPRSSVIWRGNFSPQGAGKPSQLCRGVAVYSAEQLHALASQAWKDGESRDAQDVHTYTHTHLIIYMQM